MSLLQAEVERRGTQIFDLVDRHPESIFSKAGFYQRMMEFSMRDEHFKTQLFRFVPVPLGKLGNFNRRMTLLLRQGCARMENDYQL